MTTLINPVANSVTNSAENLNFDVLIIGAGPAGLSAAIELAKSDNTLQIAVLEKSQAIGGHIVSGAVMDPRAIDQLLPDWRKEAETFGVNLTCVSKNQDKFYYLTKKHALRLPVPYTLNNHNNYIISLNQFCQYLGHKAEQLGVLLFPGFAAKKLIFADSTQKKIIGVKTCDQGLDKNSKPTANFQPGINIIAKHTVIAEGCRGSITKTLGIYKNQTYGLGIKEIWQVMPDNPYYKPGTVVHTIGWPLDQKTYGGSFIYHLNNNLIAAGFIVGLDYKNPYLSPFAEFQRFKHHPKFINLFKNSKRIGYSARSLNEGGYQALAGAEIFEKLEISGALITGCALGLLNVARLKGIDSAIYSGIYAAQAILQKKSYSKILANSKIWQELYKVRNIRPGFKWGLVPGLIISAFETYISQGKLPYTIKHAFQGDNLSLKNKTNAIPIDYPAPDHKISFDKLTSLALCNINHPDNQPCHLKLKDKNLAITYNLANFDAPETKYCPAGVYEIIWGPHKKPYLQINAQNCIHCKACDIKDPLQNITWTPPEYGSGPNYILS